MVAERKRQIGLITNGARGLVQNLGPLPELRPLQASDNLINDIYRFSGLSDEEIAKALGLTQAQFLAFRCGYLEDSGKTISIARDFLRTNMILAVERPIEYVADWWRTERKEGATGLDVWANNLIFRK